MTSGTATLTGRHILVVEDEALIAMLVQTELQEAGCEVIGPAPTVERALQLVEREAPDGAVLDYRLGEETSQPIAAWLFEHHIPFLLLTGHTMNNLPVELSGQIVLQKPVPGEALLAALEAIFTASEIK